MKSYNVKLNIILFLIIFFGIFGFAKSSLADTYTAASCSQTDVQAAINYASDGDLVVVPAGDCTWETNPVTVTEKSIILQGAGIDQTIIRDNTGTGWLQPALLFNSPTNGKSFDLSGFTFSNPSGDDLKVDGSNGAVNVRGNKNWRIHDNKFTEAYYSIITSGYAYGLIDHNTFDSTNTGTYIWVDGDGATSWTRPSSLGRAEAVYIEDNTFYKNPAVIGGRAVGSQNGGRYVFRYNTSTNVDVDAHGYCGSYATFNYEVYNNTFSIENNVSIFRWMFLRGGSGVIYNNTMINSGTLYRPIDMTEYRLSGIDSCSNAMKTCCTSYPCEEQIGRGTNGILDPVYFWNNKVNGKDAVISVNQVIDSDNTCLPVPDINDFIQLNRDYYVGVPKPSYTPYAYPHPLRNESSSDTVPPKAPSGLTVN